VTWDTCWSGFSSVADIEWSDQDRLDIDLWLAPTLGKHGQEIAPNVAQGMAKMAAVKYANENGIDYGYWQLFFSDEYGIKCGNRNGCSRFIRWNYAAFA